MKEIGGKFGTSVLSYFLFLKWLLMFNIFSFLVNFSFITIPVLVFEPSPNTPANVTFRGLELLTGAVRACRYQSTCVHVNVCVCVCHYYSTCMIKGMNSNKH